MPNGIARGKGHGNHRTCNPGVGYGPSARSPVAATTAMRNDGRSWATDPRRHGLPRDGRGCGARHGTVRAPPDRKPTASRHRTPTTRGVFLQGTRRTDHRRSLPIVCPVSRGAAFRSATLNGEARPGSQSLPAIDRSCPLQPGMSRSRPPKDGSTAHILTAPMRRRRKERWTPPIRTARRALRYRSSMCFERRPIWFPCDKDIAP